MDIYQCTKDNITNRQAAERYGVLVSRNGMCRCPFHDDHTPSMKLNESYFYCFACGANGDVIALTAKLLSVRPYEAAQRLLADFSLFVQPSSPVEAEKRKQAQTAFAQAQQAEQRCYLVIMDYLQLLRNWKVHYAPHLPTDTLSERFVEACQMIDHMEYLAEQITSSDPETRRIALKHLLKDDQLTRLEAYLKRMKETEECHHVRSNETA